MPGSQERSRRPLKWEPPGAGRACPGDVPVHGVLLVSWVSVLRVFARGLPKGSSLWQTRTEQSSSIFPLI